MRETAEKVVGNCVAVDILPAPTEGAMSNDEITVEDEVSEDKTDDEPLEEELPDDKTVDDELLVDDEGKGEGAIAAGAKVTIDKETNRLKIDTFQTTPTRLINVYTMN